MTDTREAKITINGQLLSIGESMTVRVALTTFHSTLIEEGIGDDEHGKRLASAYAARCEDVLRKIMEGVR